MQWRLDGNRNYKAHFLKMFVYLYTELVQVPSLDGTGLGIMVGLMLGTGLAMRRRGQLRNSRSV